MQIYSKITGTGSYLPPNKVTNEALAAQLAKDGVETSDEWIVERTGIRARHFAERDVPSSELALHACRHALEAAGKEAQDIDLIIVATSTPDMVFPSTATILQNKLGVHGCPAFDVQAVCSGFIYALTIADAMIRAGTAKTALVVGAEVFSRILNFKDRTTCVLFGDGAGAVILEASDTPGVLASDIHADGRYRDILCVPGNVYGGEIIGDPMLQMDGQAVFKLAVGLLDKAARALWTKRACNCKILIGWCRIRPIFASCKALHANCTFPLSVWWSRWTSMATLRQRRFRWPWTMPCATAKFNLVNGS